MCDSVDILPFEVDEKNGREFPQHYSFDGVTLASTAGTLPPRVTGHLLLFGKMYKAVLCGKKQVAQELWDHKHDMDTVKYALRKCSNIVHMDTFMITYF